MNPDDFFFRKAGMLRNVFKIRAVFTTIAGRDLIYLFRDGFSLSIHLDDGFDAMVKLLIGNSLRIIVNEQGAVCRDHVDDTGDLLRTNQLHDRSDALVDCRAYDLLELDKKAGVTLRHDLYILHENSLRKVFQLCAGGLISLVIV